MTHDTEYDDIIQAEDKAWNDFSTAIRLIVSGLEYTWPTGGDEDGSGVLLAIKTSVEEAGYIWPSRNDGSNPPCPKDGYQKKAIPNGLRMKVFERDMYRCKNCGTHKSLTCDHIYPEVLGGDSTLDNLQTLCKSCNCKKGKKVPEVVS